MILELILDKLGAILKKQRYVFSFFIVTVYSWAVKRISQGLFGEELPMFISAMVMCLFSLPITALCLFLVKDIDKKRRWLLVFLSTYIFPAALWYVISRVAYIWSSYLGGEFFLCLSLYLGGMSNALWSVGIGTASVITVILYKILGGKNEDPRNDTK